MRNTYGDIKDKITEKNEYVKAIVDTVQEPFLVLDKNLKIIAANANFYSSFEINKEAATGKVIYELEDIQLNISRLKNLIEEVLLKGDREGLEIPYVSKEAKHILLVNARQFKKEEENIDLIFLSFKNVSKQTFKEEKDYKEIFQTILSQAPAMICTVRGPEHIFELANEKYLQLVGKREIIGKTVREALPEVENQGFFEILDNVYSSGEAFVGNEIPIEFLTNEYETKISYLDFLYQPIRHADGNIDGIFVHAVDVTEQVLARKKVEESERQLKKLIDTVPAIVWISDLEGHNSYLNKSWYDYTGQTEKQSDKFGWLEALHPDDVEQAEKVFFKAHQEQKGFNESFRLRDKNGNYRWVLNSGSPNYDLKGKYDGMIGTLVDVHEEKLKEQEIRDKEFRLRTIVEEATVATAVYTSNNMKIELANDAMVQLWHKDRSVVGKSLRQALPELEGQPFHELLQEVYTTGKTYWGKEDRVDLMINGKIKTGYFNFTYKPLRNEKGEIYGILNMALDITETVRSKALLKESESRFRQMADLMPDKVANADAVGNFVYFNQGWLDYTGLSREELKVQGWTSFIHPEEKANFHRRWQNSLDTGANFEMEFRCMDKNRKYNWHLSRAEAVKDEDGKIKMWISTNTLIQKLKEEEKRKEDFLKMVSHELKTPVTSIKGYVQLLLSILKSEKDVQLSSLPLKPSLERIDHQIVRLTRLISEILDLSRLEENKLELKKENFYLNDLVDETVQDIILTNTKHQIKVNHDYKCEVYADRDRIGQVIINFITNAIKYSPDSQYVEVNIQKFGDGQVTVSVKDEGIGIDKKHHKNIFKRFYRVGGRKSEETYSGFGIGLYLAHEIIQRHNGFIDVRSKKGEGSDFSFTLSVSENNK